MTLLSCLVRQVPPTRQHLPGSWQPRPDNELPDQTADVRTSGWESEHGFKHLPGEEKTEERKPSGMAQTDNFAHSYISLTLQECANVAFFAIFTSLL